MPAAPSTRSSRAVASEQMASSRPVDVLANMSAMPVHAAMPIAASTAMKLMTLSAF